jgi:hypothetical protein
MSVLAGLSSEITAILHPAWGYVLIPGIDNKRARLLVSSQPSLLMTSQTYLQFLLAVVKLTALTCVAPEACPRNARGTSSSKLPGC